MVACARRLKHLTYGCARGGHMAKFDGESVAMDILEHTDTKRGAEQKRSIEPLPKIGHGG